MSDIKFPTDTPDITPTGSDRILIADASAWYAASDAPLSSLPVSTPVQNAINAISLTTGYTWYTGYTWTQWATGYTGPAWFSGSNWATGATWYTWPSWAWSTWYTGYTWFTGPTWTWTIGATGYTWYTGPGWAWSIGATGYTGYTWPGNFTGYTWYTWPMWPTGPSGAWSWNVNWPASSTDNAITRFDWTSWTLIQNSLATIDDAWRLHSTYTAIWDMWTEWTWIVVNWATYESTFKVSDIDWTNFAQNILHRHSTLLEPLIWFARSNTDTNSHADVTNSMNVWTIVWVWTAWTDYKIFWQMSIAADDTWTISNTSSPGKITFYITPDWSVTPVDVLVIHNDAEATFSGNVSANNLSWTNTWDETNTSIYGKIWYPMLFHWVDKTTYVSQIPSHLTTTTFTLTCTTNNLTYYRLWVKTTVSTVKTVTISSWAWTKYLYFTDDTGTITSYDTFQWLDWDKVYIATVNWNWSNYWLINLEIHAHDRNIEWHTWAHSTIWARYQSWLTLTASWTWASATFSLSAWAIRDEDILFSINTQTTARQLYQTWASAYWFDTTATTTPSKLWANSRPWYVDSSTYVWTQVASAANRYLNYFVYATTDLLNPMYVFTETVAASTINAWTWYSSLAAARSIPFPNLSTFWLTAELKPIFRLIVRADWVVQTIDLTQDDYRTSSSLPMSAGSTTTTASSVTESNYGNVQTAINTILATSMTGPTWYTWYTWYTWPSGSNWATGYTGYTGTQWPTWFTWYTGPWNFTGYTWYTWYTWPWNFTWYTWPIGPTWPTWYTWPIWHTGYTWYTGPGNFTGYTGFTWYTWPGNFTWYTWFTGATGYTGPGNFTGYTGYTWANWPIWATWYTWPNWPTWFTGYTWPGNFTWYTWYTGYTWPSWTAWWAWATGPTWYTWYTGPTTVPQNSQSTNYTTVAWDSGKHIYHPSADTTARTFTIDSNANVAYAIWTAITFVNDTSGWVITIAITTDTLVLAWAWTTWSRTLAANWIATALKITSTRWIISGNWLT